MKLLTVFMLLAAIVAALGPNESEGASTVSSGESTTIAATAESTAVPPGETTSIATSEANIVTEEPITVPPSETTSIATSEATTVTAESTAVPPGETTSIATSEATIVTEEPITVPPSETTSIATSEATTVTAKPTTLPPSETTSVATSEATTVTEEPTTVATDETTSVSSATTTTNYTSNPDETTSSAISETSSTTPSNTTTVAPSETTANTDETTNGTTASTATTDTTPVQNGSTNPPSTEAPPANKLQCYACEGDDCDEKTVVNCPDDGRAYDVEDINKSLSEKAAEILLHNYRSVSRLELADVKGYACYRVQITDNDDKTLKLGCIAIPYGQSACEAVRNELNITATDESDECLACQTDLCNGGAIANLSVAVLLSVLLAKFFV